MLETGLESVAYNLNRKNNDLKFFEFGKTYHAEGVGKYVETDHLCFFVTGNRTEASWKEKAIPADIYYLKGIVEAVLSVCGVKELAWETSSVNKLKNSLFTGSLFPEDKRITKISVAPASIAICTPAYFITPPSTNW